MLELRQWQNGTIELVSDDARAENAAVSDALDGTSVGILWDAAPFEGGELVVKLTKAECMQVENALAGNEEHGYLFGDVLAQLDEVNHS